jgi:hypothetical protein
VYVQLKVRMPGIVWVYAEGVSVCGLVEMEVAVEGGMEWGSESRQVIRGPRECGEEVVNEDVLESMMMEECGRGRGCGARWCGRASVVDQRGGGLVTL